MRKSVVISVLVVIVLLVVVWFLVGFFGSNSSDGNKPVDIQHFNFSDSPRTEQDCLKLNGVWGFFGLTPVEQCNLPTPDAGKECSDGSECYSFECLTDIYDEPNRTEDSEKVRGVKGKCAPNTLNVGCYGRINEGVATVLCVD